MPSSAGETLVEKAREAGLTTDTAVEETAAEQKPARRKRQPRAEEPTDAPPTDTPAETPETTPETAAEKPAWMQRLESDLGFENVADPEEAANRAIDYALQQKRDAEELEAWRRQNEAFVGYGREYLAKQPQQTEQKPAETQKPWQPPVAYPEAAARYLSRKEDGTAEWKQDTPAEVRAQAEKFIAWREQMQDTLLNRPDLFFSQVLPQFIQEHVKQYVEPFYEERTKEQQTQQYLAKFEADNEAWLFAHDPQTGKPNRAALSRAGELLRDRLHEHMQRGYSAEEALTYAQYDIQRQTGATPWVKADSAAEIREQKKREHARKPLNGAGSVAPRKGSFTEPGEGQQNRNLSFGQSLVNQARLQGVPVESITAT